MSAKYLNQSVVDEAIQLRCYNERIDNALFVAGYQEKELSGHTVTQQTSLTTAVTLNTTYGIITTVTATTGTSASEVFTLNNSEIDVNQAYLVSIFEYDAAHDGSAGIPQVEFLYKSAGKADIIITNQNPAAALNGVLKIYFEIIRLF